MIPALIFLQFLSYSLGIASLIITAQRYLRSHDRIMRYYLVFLAVFTVRITVNTLLFYMRAGAQILDSSALFEIITVFQVSGDINILMVLCLPVLFHGILGIRHRKTADFLILLIAAVVGVMKFYPYLFAFNRTVSFYPVRAVSAASAVLTAAVCIYLAVLFILYDKRIKDRFQKSAARSIFVFFAVFILFDYLTARNTFILSQIGETAPFLANFGFYAFWNAYFLCFTVKSDREIRNFVMQSGISDTFVKKFGITAREKEVIGMIMQGMSNPDIADKLYLSLKTVKNHIHNIFQKTGVRTRMELSHLAMQD